MTKNERMKRLLKSGNVLKEGVVRGDIIIAGLPKQSKTNDVKMRKRSGILYGNTKYTDEQIVYFYNKHNGKASAAARELRMCIAGYITRLNKLGLRPRGHLQTCTDKQITTAYHKHNGVCKYAIKELNISVSNYYLRTRLLGLPPRGSKNTQRYTDKQIITVYHKHKGNREKASMEIGISLNGLRSRLIKLKLIKVGKKGGPKSFTNKKFMDTMKQTHGNVSETAFLLKCHINTVYTCLSKLKITAKSFRSKRDVNPKIVLYGTVNGITKKLGTFNSTVEAATAEELFTLGLEHYTLEGTIKWTYKKKPLNKKKRR